MASMSNPLGHVSTPHFHKHAGEKGRIAKRLGHRAGLVEQITEIIRAGSAVRKRDAQPVAAQRLNRDDLYDRELHSSARRHLLEWQTHRILKIPSP
jgi:hypothetical protein